jgi:phosphatidylinositol 4-phosphatase
LQNYDYTLEKVKMYTRVPLGDITEINHGTSFSASIFIHFLTQMYYIGAYILSPLEEASRDPLQNAGLTITWRKTHEQVTRMTTYSLTNSPAMAPPSSTASPTSSRMTTAIPRPSLLARRSTVLSKVLIPSPTEDTEKDTAYAAFKALPVDPSRVSENGADELSGAANCKEAVDLIVDAIVRACNGNVVVNNTDIVRCAILLIYASLTQY